MQQEPSGSFLVRIAYSHSMLCSCFRCKGGYPALLSHLRVIPATKSEWIGFVAGMTSILRISIRFLDMTLMLI
jgi:hypothetical protein